MKKIILIFTIALFSKASFALTNFQLTTSTNTIAVSGGVNYYTLLVPTSNNASGDIMIKNGCWVKLDSKFLKMKQGKRITVEKGAVLEITGSTISSEDDNRSLNDATYSARYWLGIIVKGDPTYHHDSSQLESFAISGYSSTFTNTPAGSGILILKSTDTLRYSANAVTLDSGGYLYARNAYFINSNQRDIYFKHDPSMGMSDFNQTSIRDCYFILSNKALANTIQRDTASFTNTLPMPGTNKKAKIGIHVDTSTVLRYDIYNCNFQNKVLQSGSIPMVVLFYGVFANGSFVSITKSTFDKLGIGIFTINPFANFTFLNADSNNFTFNMWGIWCEGSDNAWIGANTFDLGRQYGKGVYGVTMNGSSGYEIFANSFSRSNTYNSIPQNSDAGIKLGSCNYNYGKIECNSFTKMAGGIISVNDNRNVKIVANAFVETYLNDIFDTSVASNISGIYPIQGYPNNGAGNFFDLSPFKTSKGGYYWNDNLVLGQNATSKLKYYYKSPTALENPIRYRPTAKITKTTTSTSLNCPQAIPPHGSYHDQIDSFYSNYKSLESGGVSESEMPEYFYNIGEFERYLHLQVIDYYKLMYNGAQVHYKDSIDTLLTLHPSQLSTYLLLQRHLTFNETSSAQTIVNTMRSDSAANEDWQGLCDWYDWVISAKNNSCDSTWMANHIGDLDSLTQTTSIAARKACGTAGFVYSYSDLDDTLGLEMFTFSDMNVPMDYDYGNFDVDTPADLDHHIILSCSPNPFTDPLSVVTQNTIGSVRTIQIKIYDLYLQQYYSSGNITLLPLQTVTTTVGTSGYPSGYYIVAVYESGNLIAYKIVLQS